MAENPSNLARPMPACHIHVALGDVVELAELGVIHDTDPRRAASARASRRW
jgi:hypothetical protein